MIQINKNVPKNPMVAKIATDTRYAEWYEIRCIAEMNQRYHQATCLKWDRADFWCKIANGFLATVGACTTAVSVSLPSPSTALNVVAIVSSALATSFAIILNVAPFQENGKRSAVLFHLWSRLVLAADELRPKLTRLPPDKADETLRQFWQEKNRIDALEPYVSPEALQPFLAAVERSLQPQRVPAA